MPVRNEEKYLGKTLADLIKQTLKPYRIIVINDGSTDKTAEIALKFENVEVINRENTGDHRVTKEIIRTINVGLKQLDNDNDCDYIMKLDADILLPTNYLSLITQRMDANPTIAVSSGIIHGEFTVTPRGGGRIVRYDFWKKLGLRYPENYSYEGYLLVKARIMGYQLATFEDIVMKTQRKTGSTYNPRFYLNSGKGMKALGYTFPFTLISAIVVAKKSWKGSYYLLRGYLSNYDELYEQDLREYVRKYQFQKIKHLKLKNVKRLFNILKHT